MYNPFHRKCESNCLTDYETNFDSHEPSSGPGYFSMKSITGKKQINCHYRFPENTSYFWFIEGSEFTNENEIIWMTHGNNFLDPEIIDDPYNLETYKTYVNSR